MRDRLEIGIVVVLCAALAAHPSAPAAVVLATIGAALVDTTAVRLQSTAASQGETGQVLRLARFLHGLAITLSLVSLLVLLRPF